LVVHHCPFQSNNCESNNDPQKKKKRVMVEHMDLDRYKHNI
jgi:hypothetical protein